MNYIGNAISLNMFDIGQGMEIVVRPVPPQEVPNDAISAIGYEETASAASRSLGRTVEPNRINVKLKNGDVLFVFQHMGERLERTQKGLPEDPRWEWFEVKHKKS